jgi:hypothetical protein
MLIFCDEFDVVEDALKLNAQGDNGFRALCIAD